MTDEDRGRAVRRAREAGRRGRALHMAGCALLLAVALTAGAVAVGAARGGGDAVAAAAPADGNPAVQAGADLDAGVASLQAHLRAQPRDHNGWASLGLAYVEQARTKADPSRYPQAEQALRRSLDLRPGNDAALAGRAALAAARHDFTGALAYADRALAENPYSERALCSRIDALVELGRYDEAARAADTADRRRPGVPVFTRYAYVRELRGDVAGARAILERALDTATGRGDIAYVATQLGHLARSQGDYAGALHHYARALAADDSYLPALEGRARAQAASGDRATAVRNLERIVARAPLPSPLIALGELYEERGERAKAREQYALVDAWTALARANGVDADLETALAAADHGDTAAALRAARAEWKRRQTVHTADALAWALHVDGRDAEALAYARRATATGYRNALFLYHRGMIERGAGHRAEGRALLTEALGLDPGFSPLGARAARTALEETR
ncbi:tetratricopeptide repeat protein [Streptomyces actuosus]|uniref:tetratricopeptide repeat protein n=1 Tax=Streptomyces actuosus TaxID=1885 RepID=UPI003F684E7C